MIHSIPASGMFREGIQRCHMTCQASMTAIVGFFVRSKCEVIIGEKEIEAVLSR